LCKTPGAFLVSAIAGCFGAALALAFVSRKWEGSLVGQWGLAAGLAEQAALPTPAEAPA
jgi:hypothetical protein